MDTDNKILVVSEQTTVDEQLQEIVDNYSKTQYIRPNEVNKEIDRIDPDIVLLFQPEDGSSVELIQYIQENSAAHIILLNDRENFELLREAMRAGVTEFFVVPDEIAPLKERLGKIERLIKQHNSNEVASTSQGLKRGKGQVYSFYSGKGGSGRTLLATGYAQTLKLESTAEIMLIDLNLQFGGAEAYLSIESNRSLADLQPVINELSENHIKSVTEREKHSQLELLLSPKDAETAEFITEEFVTRLIRTSRRYYDFVIIDLPPMMNEVTYTALEESDLIYYVMNLDTPSISVFKTAEELFEQLHLGLEGRLEIVVNQMGKDNELKVSDLKEFIKYPVAAEIRRDHKGVQAAINQGEALRKEAKEKKLISIAKDLRKWVLKNLK